MRGGGEGGERKEEEGKVREGKEGEGGEGGEGEGKEGEGKVGKGRRCAHGSDSCNQRRPDNDVMRRRLASRFSLVAVRA